MGRTIKSKVKIEEVFFDEELYPRSGYYWQTAYVYSESMKAGSKFPPIILALHNGKKYLVDGKHRIEAYKLLKIKSVDAVIHTGWNKQRIYKEAIKSNIAHGKILTPYDKRLIAVKLMEMKCKNSEISDLIHIPQDKIESFVGQRLVNSLSGEPIESDELEKNSKEIQILKSGVKQYSGQSLTREDFNSLREIQRSFNIKSQIDSLTQIINLLENDLIDKEDNKVLILLIRLKKLLKDY